MLTDAQLEVVRKVHARVFRIFTYKTDLEKYRVLEHWADTTELTEQLEKGELVGDCDDFALACRQLLNAEGIPNRLVFCVVEGEGHLVCEAEGYILDNRQTKVLRADEMSDYEFIKMSGYNKGDPWTMVA